ncbi:hypothetical protein EsDP_00000661 [Epichloe bromicola]|uniref:F-box domain-containing protein n=1 Tax=Epichloe bromicola TaxID=79588 RepID=A0ABQ0CFL7_9HYPO
MPLHRLPPEILLYILRLLGSAFFRQDARRLTVSKRWFQHARPVLLQDLDFSAQSLGRFVLACTEEGMTLFHAKSRQDGDTESSRFDIRVIESWTAELNECMAALASMLQKCTGLRLLKLEARPELHDSLVGMQRRDYLLASPLASLLSISCLTCLEIDTAGTNLIGQIHTPRTHICVIIREKLPNLRRLRYRSSSICPSILDASENKSLLTLEDVLINLSLSEMSSPDTSHRYPSRCGYTPGASFPRLREDMESRATELVRMIRTPRIVRILSPTFPALSMHSFDALKGRRMHLPSAAPWDADGEEVKEMAVVQDPFDPDSSSEEFVL